MNIYTVDSIEKAKETQCEIKGQYVAARPINHRHRSMKEKIQSAWWAFTGKYDLLKWPEGQ